MSYLLVLVSSVAYFLPSSIQITEFKTKAACEIALKEANQHFIIVEKDSKCVSTEEYLKKEKAKEELKKIINNEN